MNAQNTLIVISRHKKDVSWTQKLSAEGFHVIVYDHHAHNNHPYFIKENKGREASVYLKYIVDYYYTLFPYTIFLQDEDKSWHHQGSIVELIKSQKEKKTKFFNFNHRCLALIKSNALFPMMESYFHDYLQPYIGHIEKYKDWTAGYKCCAQFVVHRDYIRKYPRKMYEDMLSYMLDGKHDEKAKGHMFEWTLHLLFENPFIIHHMSEDKYQKMMEARIKKIEAHMGRKEQVRIDGCRIIVNYD